ncbi:hypothetical protein F5883DRAFT_546816 [Diaporthe sp. PMI_573]|jgi:hypothetical protein|nr:hypothetical protein F5883DRAFT_546816 [Diaporthaceae sp. PMI_573]
MSAPLPDSQIDGSGAPPPYDAVSSPGAPADLAQEKAPLPDAIEDQDESALDSEPPPPFTVTPGTLILARDAVLIRGAVPGARPLYQLSRPLNGHATMVTLMDVPAQRRLNGDGTIEEVQERDKLYKIYQHRDLANLSTSVAEVSSQKLGQLEGVRLRKETSMGLTGMKESFDATWGDEDSRKPLYQARQKKGILEWRDSANKLVAVNIPAGAQRLQDESLEVLVSLGKKHLDLIVALWMARVWHDTQAEGLKEGKQEAKRRKSEQRQLDKEEGRPSGRIHDMKEALGIGYGVKGPSNGFYPGGMPATSPNGRIDWGGSKD